MEYLENMNHFGMVFLVILGIPLVLVTGLAVYLFLWGPIEKPAEPEQKDDDTKKD